jgi:hypothetical protein
MTTTASTLDSRLGQVVGDYVTFDVTTILSDTTVVNSTELNNYDDAKNDKYNGWWLYVTEFANAGAERKVYDYATSGGILSVRGDSFAADSGTDKATCVLSRYSYSQRKRALNDAIRELGGILFKRVDDRTLITGNWLPNSHFEKWAVATIPDFYTAPDTGTCSAVTTAGLIWGGTTSCLFTAGGDSEYFKISSDDYPQLLDLMGSTVTVRAWAYPSVEDDAFIQIYTLQGDTAATAQTLTSTTENTASQWNLLELENQTLNDDLVTIEIRFGAKTSATTVYWDNARLIAQPVYEYMLPENYQDGSIQQVYIQESSAADHPCDDLHSQVWDRVFSDAPFIHNDGSYNYLRLPYSYSTERQIRIIGTSPLTTVDSWADTVEIDGDKVDLLVNYAAYKLMMNEMGVVSAEDTARFKARANDFLREYYRLLPALRMTKVAGTLNSSLR